MLMCVNSTRPRALVNTCLQWSAGLPVSGNKRYRRPVRRYRQLTKRKRTKLAGSINNFASHYRQHRFYPLDLLFLDVEKIHAERYQIGQLAYFQHTLFALLRREPGAAMSKEFKRYRAGQAFGIKLHTSHCLTADQPVKRGPGIIARHARGISARAHRYALGKHALDRRSLFCRLATVTVNEIFALKRHAILNRDPSTQRAHAFDVTRRNGFCVVEEPWQTVEGNILIYPFEHIQHARDGFVVGRMQAERPSMFHQVTNYRLKVLLHLRREVRARLKKVFEICRREH